MVSAARERVMFCYNHTKWLVLTRVDLLRNSSLASKLMSLTVEMAEHEPSENPFKRSLWG